jgi:hypothetical protein
MRCCAHNHSCHSITCRWTHTDRREAVAAVAGGVTPDMLQAHATKCLTSLHFELLCHGNLSPNEVSHILILEAHFRQSDCKTSTVVRAVAS